MPIDTNQVIAVPVVLVFTITQWLYVRPAATNVYNALLSLSVSPVLLIHEEHLLLVVVRAIRGTMTMEIRYVHNAVPIVLPAILTPNVNHV